MVAAPLLPPLVAVRQQHAAQSGSPTTLFVTHTTPPLGHRNMIHRSLCLILFVSCSLTAISRAQERDDAKLTKILPAEQLSGDGTWLMPACAGKHDEPYQSPFGLRTSFWVMAIPTNIAQKNVRRLETPRASQRDGCDSEDTERQVLCGGQRVT